MVNFFKYDSADEFGFYFYYRGEENLNAYIHDAQIYKVHEYLYF